MDSLQAVLLSHSLPFNGLHSGNSYNYYSGRFTCPDFGEPMSAQRTVQKLWGWEAAPKLELKSGKSWRLQKFKTYSFSVCWILVDMYHHWGPPIISVYCSFILLCVRCPAVKDNSRYDSLQFDIDVDTMLHGFGGYFYCVLYGDIAFSMLRTRWLSFFALQTTCILSCSVVSKSVGGFLKCS